jgi:two-component system response regulator AtoC
MITWQPGIKLEEMEKQIILAAMQFFHGNKQKVADSLGISIRTVRNKLNQYGIEKETLSDERALAN